MRILHYADFDGRGLEAPLARAREALIAGDFAAAQVRKMHHVSLGKLYRARLNDADRLLFLLCRHEEEMVLLFLEVIRAHRYEQSRFLRGAQIDSEKIVSLGEAKAEADALRYLSAERGTVHFLDKPLSFDSTQDALFAAPLPILLVGGAGSGKTALLLEKLKRLPGDVLYVTHSAYLAEQSRELYYAHGFQALDQESSFLSYRDYLETWEIPAGRELTWRDFYPWFQKQRTGKGIEAHALYEEIRGVLCAQAQGVLSASDYEHLGVRQSLFPTELRPRVYELFERYQAWLRETGQYDANLVAQAWLEKIAPRYDSVVIDEVQDLTPIQLTTLLRALRHPGNFLLAGDAHQIVHPNFFSWSQIKSLFWQDPDAAAGATLQVLTHNFRNGRAVTQMANRLLEIKQQRFGSVDRESNFLVEAVGSSAGRVQWINDDSATLADLDRKISRSTQYAVLVLREEDKAAAKRVFSTPLVFSVQEAKGLEYPHVVLYRILSDERKTFAEVCAGVSVKDLGKTELVFRRAKDKQDKSLEIYKFFVNALYVALTRAQDSLLWIESDHQHPLLSLLGVHDTQATGAAVEVAESSAQDWQREARKLELQGKTEQAEAIRERLRPATPPWPILTPHLRKELQDKVFVEKAPGDKARRTLLEYGAFHDDADLIDRLAKETYRPAQSYDPRQNKVFQHRLDPYRVSKPKQVLDDCARYGVDHHTPMDTTPLQMAARVGNVALVESLLQLGADPEIRDAYGHQALHYALREALVDARFAHGPFAPLWALLAPPYLDLRRDNQLLRLDRSLPEYLLVQTLWAILPWLSLRFRTIPYMISADVLADLWEILPITVLPPHRNKKAYISNLLSRNEVNSNYAYSRRIVYRRRRGWYTLHPNLALRDSTSADGWRHWVELHGLVMLQELEGPEPKSFRPSLLSFLRDDTGLQQKPPATVKNIQKAAKKSDPKSTSAPKQERPPSIGTQRQLDFGNEVEDKSHQ